MHVFAIQPLVGIGPVRFGQIRGEVLRILAGLGETAPAYRRPNADCFFQNSFQVFYDADGRVEFVEASSSKEFQLQFQGCCLHELLAEDAVRFVSQFAEYDWNHPELGYSYIFPALQLSLWRQVLPSPEFQDGHHFDTVGAGKHGYFGLSTARHDGVDS